MFLIKYCSRILGACCVQTSRCHKNKKRTLNYITNNNINHIRKTIQPLLTIAVPEIGHILYIHEISAERIYEVLAAGIYLQFSLFGVFRCREHKILSTTGGKHFNAEQHLNIAAYGKQHGNTLHACYKLPLAELAKSLFARAAM